MGSKESSSHVFLFPGLGLHNALHYLIHIEMQNNELNNTQCPYIKNSSTLIDTRYTDTLYIYSLTIYNLFVFVRVYVYFILHTSI